MKKHLKLLVASFLAATVVLSACGTKPPEKAQTDTTNNETTADNSQTQGDKILKYATNFPDMTSMDVHKFTQTDVIMPARTMAESLLMYDDNYHLQPLLLESMPEQNEDATLFTLKLKKGVKFHDGTELTAKDVAFTFNRIFDPKTENLNTWLCDMIKGGKDMLEGKTTTLEGLKVIDDYTFTIELEMPYAPFLNVLAAPQMMIYPEKACTEAGDMWGIDTFVGTGPFEFVELTPKDNLHVKKFAGYHGTPAKLDELYIYHMEPSTSLLEFESGNMDMVLVENKNANSFKDGEFKDNLHKVDIMGIISLNLNTTKAPLDNVKVREAMYHAIDNESLVANYLQGNGTPANSVIPPGIMAHPNRKGNSYDPEKAKALLVEAGYPNGIDLETYAVENKEMADIMIVIQEQLKASNIRLKVNLVDASSYTDLRRNGSVQTPLLTWYKDIVDPDNFTYTFYHSDASKMFSSNWKDAKTDELLEKGRAAKPEDREAIYKELEEYIQMQQFITKPLFNPVMYYLVSDSVSGIKYDDSMVLFNNADINK